MRRLSRTEWLLSLGTCLVLLLFVLIVRNNLDAMRTLRDESTLAMRTLEVQRRLDGVLLAEVQADSAARAFLLTRNPSLLPQLRDAQAQAVDRVEQLAGLSAGNPAVEQRVPHLREAVRRMNTRLAAVVATREAGTIGDALDAARSADTSGARSDIRRIIADMEREELRQLAERRTAADQAYERAVGGRVGSAVVSGALLVAVTLLSLRHARGRADREASLMESERRAREAAEREQEARAEAELANRRKDQFLAVLSHELRTPLNAVLGWTQILQVSKVEEATLARALASIRRNAEAQQHLVEDLLDVSRILAGKLPMERASVDLRDVVAQVVEAMRPDAARKGLELVASLGDAGSVNGDRHRMRQVVANLLSNAVKFTPQGGRVTVTLTREGHTAALLEVQDTGQGFDESFAPRLFERFQQSDASTTRLHGGLGLGLAIVKHIVDAHGGTIEGASDGPQQGATFRVRLPTV